jgi:hypothetical protein
MTQGGHRRCSSQGFDFTHPPLDISLFCHNVSGHLVDKTSNKGEILRNAQRLVQTRGDGAVGYAKKMAERMQETGEVDDQAFWERIAAQIELLVHEYPPDES